MTTKRPPFLIFIAVLGILTFAGIVSLFITVGLVLRTDMPDVAVTVLFIAFALFRLATAVSLLRLRERARIVELVYNWIKLIATIVVGLYVSIPEFSDDPVAALGFVVIAALLASFPAIVLMFLRRPDIRLVFSASIAELPEEERAAVQARLRHTSAAQWAAMILASVVFAGVAYGLAESVYNGVQRSSQKRTMADMRAIANAWETCAMDLNRYNTVGALTLPQAPVSVAELSRHLAPQYIKSVPAVDGWGHPYQFLLDVPFGGSAPAQTYAIRSYGRDGKASPLVEGTTNDFDCDIVYSNGSFLVYPEAVAGGG